MDNLLQNKIEPNIKWNQRIIQITCLEKVSKDELAYEDYQPKEHISALIEYIDKKKNILLDEKISVSK